MARDFDGSTGYLSNPDGDALSLTSRWTLSLWLYPDVGGNLKGFVTHQGSVALPIVLATGQGGSEGAAGCVFGGFFHSSNTWRVVNESVALVTGRWIHYACTWDGSNVKLYRNGRRVGTELGSGSPQAATTDNDFYIGRNWAGTGNADCKMEHVAIWDVALPQESITRLASSLQFDPRQVLGNRIAAYWPLTGDALDRDLGPNALHMTANGTTGPFNGLINMAEDLAVPVQTEFAILPGQDSATVRLSLTVSSVQVFEAIDTTTVYLDLQPSGTEAHAREDAATIYLDIRNVGGECYSTYSGMLLGEGEADTRWATSEDVARWTGDDELRWSYGEAEREGVHC